MYLGSKLLCTIRDNRLCQQYKDRPRFFPSYRYSTIMLSLWKHDFMNKKFEGHSSNWENCSYQCSGHQRSPLKSKNWRQCRSSFFPPEALAAWIDHQQIENITTKWKQGVCHTVALPFTFKSILRQKKKYGNSNISPWKKIILKNSSKRNQNPLRYYNSIISSFNTSQNIIYFKSPHIKIDLLPRGQNPISYYHIYKVTCLCVRPTTF